MTIGVLYHNDADGFGAYYACAKALPVAWGCAVNYGEPVPEIPDEITRLYIVDFSYSREIIESLAEQYELTVIDHHATAADALAGLDYAIFDNSKSGAVLAWEYFAGRETAIIDQPVPVILQYVQDRDLYTNALPDTDAVAIYIKAIPKTIVDWDEFDLATAKATGKLLAKQRDSLVRVAVKTGIWHTGVPTAKVILVNSAFYASEIGNTIVNRGADIVAIWHVNHISGTDTVIHVELRGNGTYHCGNIAKQSGGGGHAKAAGFDIHLSGDYVEGLGTWIGKSLEKL